MQKLGFIIKLSLFSVAALFSSSAYAQEVQTDFDNDSLSDFALVTVESNKSLSWKSVNSSDGASSTLGSLGESGDHLILARWRGLAFPQIGVVSVDSETGLINWKILDELNQTREQSLGEKGDLVISGGDFDGDNLADAAVARLSRKKVTWQLVTGMFSNSSSKFYQLSFGKSGSRAFFVNADGTSDWLGVVSPGTDGHANLSIRNLVSGEVRRFNTLPAFISKVPRPRPFPIQKSDGRDILGYARVGKKNTRVDFLTLDGQRLNKTTLPGTSDIVIGNFLGDHPGEEVAIKTDAGFLVFNPFDNFSTESVKPSGVPVDYININTVGGTVSTPNNGGGNDDPPSSGGTCSNQIGLPSGFIYKTIGSNHFNDIRRNTAGLVIKPGSRGPFPSCITIKDTRGHSIANMGLYATGSGWAARYYAGIGCGSSTPLNGSAIASRARSNTGSSNVVVDFGSICYGPIDASRCIGSSQC